ncbi:MAG: hypothetical protein MPI93_01940 [Nitrosopumilus sp.]|nr:hypothetical protein [Nitrosopumilus sp.]
MIKKYHRGSGDERFEADLGVAVIDTPAYFPAITSRCQPYPLEMLIRAAMSTGCKTMMVSAYDIYYAKSRRKLLSLLKEFSRKRVLFLDSGGFEAYRGADWDFAKYSEMVSEISPTLYAGFDVVRDEYEYNILDQTLEYMRRSSRITPDSVCAAVCHGESPDQLVTVATGVASNHPGRRASIAVPARECGQSINEKSKTLKMIRSRIDRLGKRVILHVLGCDDSMSAESLVRSGADTLDGTAWYKRTPQESICRSFSTSCSGSSTRRAPSLDSNISVYVNDLRRIRNQMLMESRLDPARIGADVSDRLQSRHHLGSGAA